MRTREETQALMKEIAERIKKMSNREYLDKVTEALAYCKARKLLSRWDGTKEGMQKAGSLAMVTMELDKLRHASQEQNQENNKSQD